VYRGLLFKLWNPIRYVGTAEARHFFFSFLDRLGRVLYNGLLMTQKGRSKGHVTYVLKFGTPSVTFERLQLSTSFLFGREAIANTTQGMMDNPTGGVVRVTRRGLLYKFWDQVRNF